MFRFRIRLTQAMFNRGEAFDMPVGVINPPCIHKLKDWMTGFDGGMPFEGLTATPEVMIMSTKPGQKNTVIGLDQASELVALLYLHGLVDAEKIANRVSEMREEQDRFHAHTEQRAQDRGVVREMQPKRRPVFNNGHDDEHPFIA